MHAPLSAALVPYLGPGDDGDIDGPQEQGLHCEEVAGQGRLAVVAQEGPPAATPTAAAGRRDPVALRKSWIGSLPTMMAIGDQGVKPCIGDAVVAPVGLPAA